jgi:hypothetical protein
MPTANVAADPPGLVPPSELKRSDRPAPRREAWIDVLVAVACILPLLLTAHLPLTDLPNHLARQYILRDWSGSPFLQAFYYIRWELVPNLALELFVLVARQAMSIDMAVRLFCITTVLMLFLGTRLVNLDLSGGRARMYRFTPLLCYGGPFQYGFLSYCIGVGAGLLLFGVYLRVRGGRPVILMAFLLASGFVLMLCHLAAFGLFALAIGGCELACALGATGAAPRRLAMELTTRLMLPVCCLGLVMLLFIGFGPAADQDAAVNAARFALRFSSLHEKARSIYAITLFASPWLEALLLAMALAGLSVALLSRTVRFHPIGLTVLVVMAIAWMFLPNVAMGSAFIDYRIPWAVSFFLLSGLVPGPSYQRRHRPFGQFFGLLAAFRIGLIAILWLQWEPTLTALDEALQKVPVGTRIKVVEGELPGGKLFRQPDFANVALYAVARRQAFEPDVFANVAGQILHFQPHFEQLWVQDNFAREIPSRLNDLAPDYDYVLVLLPEFAQISPLLPLTCQESGPNFKLLKVNRSGATLSPGTDQGSRCS